MGGSKWLRYPPSLTATHPLPPWGLGVAMTAVFKMYMVYIAYYDGKDNRSGLLSFYSYVDVILFYLKLGSLAFMMD
jgi:hypothetical protein